MKPVFKVEVTFPDGTSAMYVGQLNMGWWSAYYSAWNTLKIGPQAVASEATIEALERLTK